MISYDEIADWYDAWVDGSMSNDPHWPAVEALLDEIAGQRVCDLACGQGRVARHLASLGARVVGIDISTKLLEIARRHEAAEPRGIEYVRADARALDGVEDESFDVVICHMALMDIPDIVPTLETVARILRPDGLFVFSILHPCYNSPRSGELGSPGNMVRTVAGYFDEVFWRSDLRTGPPGKVGAYHRTLSTYVNALVHKGFKLERLSEPRATETVANRRSVWVEVPAALVVRCRKESDRGPGYSGSPAPALS